jgi:hypothetical protein
MRDAVIAVSHLKATWFGESPAYSDTSTLIALAERVVCTFMFASGGTYEAAADRRAAYKTLLRADKQNVGEEVPESSLVKAMAELDVVHLAATFAPQISCLLELFTDLVAEDGFLEAVEQPLASWALVICLWLRRLSQVCISHGPQVLCTHLEDAQTNARKQLRIAERHSSRALMRVCDVRVRMCEARVLREPSPAPLSFIDSWLQENTQQDTTARQDLPSEDGNSVMPQIG